ncbi:uncharacterized protein [Apostichopus japonicus]|uniref:uncharacterized protein isoform X2 n=1 Tax=Stichopus japonicus TaxID=307972 RepID=UPI003AB641C0
MADSEVEKPTSNSNNNSLQEKDEDDSGVFKDDSPSDTLPSLGMTKEQSKALREISRRATRVSKRKRASRVSFATVPEVINELYDGGSSKPEAQPNIEEYTDIKEEQKDLMKYVEDNVIGNDTTFKGPLGTKRVIYCDYTASGRPVKFIEEYISQHVHPLYANTHTTTGLMARQTTQFRKEARQLIKMSVNANESDVLIFCGSGTTGAVNKLVSALKLKSGGGKNTVVFVGPYEHHSNILPWKESGAMVERINDTKTGHIDTEDLDRKLKKHKKKSRRLIGCFSAASNVTGIISDTNEVSAKLHEHGALSFWDYATAGPYLKIDMNPVSDNGENYSKDAVYLSPHKFVGGVGTPGILIAKKHVFLNEVPDNVGGGTVVYVTRETHHYSTDIEEREEGGTPAIVESIRAGLTFKLKDSIGTEIIEEREEELTRLAFERWKGGPTNIIILGSSRANRLPIFSFLITHPASGKVLHHDFVAVLLNDLFGIQARGGCACAGPYAQDLLGIDEELAQKFVHFLVTDRSKESTLKKKKKSRLSAAEETGVERTIEIMKPGFVRLNLPFFFCDEAIDYILTAVEMIASDGWVFLPQYRADPYSAKWSPVQAENLQERTGERTKSDSLLTATFKGAKFSAPSSPFTQRDAAKKTFKEMLDEAKQSIAMAKKQTMFSVEAIVDDVGAAVQNEELIWFLRPQEAAVHLRRKSKSEIDGIETVQDEPIAGSDPRSRATKVPFIPKRYTVMRKSFRRSVRKLSRKSRNPEDRPNSDTQENRRGRCVVM